MKRMRKYWHVFWMALQSSLEYRVNFILSLVSGTFIIIVQCCLWNAVFSSSGLEVVNGYTYHQMILYSVVVGVVTKMNATGGFENEISNDIKNGAFSKFLTQPNSYSLFRFYNFLGGKIVQIFTVMLLIIVFFGIYGNYGVIDLTWWKVFAFFLACVGAMVINFLLFYAISSLAFTVTEVWGIFIAINQGAILLGGGIFPLDFFGETIYRILNILPFCYTLFFPVNIINGHLNAVDTAIGLLIQLFWIAILAVVARLVWKHGLKRYVAAGG